MYSTARKICTQFALYCCGLVLGDMTHNLQGYFTGTGAIMWLPQCQWRNPEGYGSSFGRTNGAPLRWRWQDGGSSASGRHLGWPHFRFPWGHFLGSRKWPHGKRKWGHPRWRPEAELPPSCHLHLNGAPFVLPMSWMTSVGRLHRSLNVLQMSASHETSRADHRESKFFQRHTEIPYDDVWLFFWLLGSIWSLASPSHSWNDWGSCPLATTRKSISLHMSTPRLMENSYPWGMVLALASTYFFFFFFLTVLYNIRDLLKSTVS